MGESSLRDLRGANTGREHRMENLRTQLVGHASDLEPRLLGAVVDLLPGSAYALLRGLPHLGEGCFALLVPLFQLAVADLEDLGLGGAQFVLVDTGLGLSRSDCTTGLLDCAGGAGARTVLHRSGHQCGSLHHHQ